MLDVVSQSTVERSKVAVVHARRRAAAVDPGARRRRERLVRRRRHGRQHLRHDPARRAAAGRGDDGHGRRRAVEEAEELSELDLSAAGEAMNQMMAAAAGATANVLGEEVEIGPPETRFFATPDEAADAYELTPHMTSVGFTAPRRAVPARAARAERVRRPHDARARRARRRGGGRAATARAGERHLGRRDPVGARCGCGPSSAAPHMPVGRAVDLATGAVVDLDRAPDDPGRAVRQRPPLRHRAAAAGRRRVGRADRNRAPAREPRTNRNLEGGTD